MFLVYSFRFVLLPHGDRLRLRPLVERAIREPVQQQPRPASIHPRPADGRHPPTPRLALVPGRVACHSRFRCRACALPTPRVLLRPPRRLACHHRAATGLVLLLLADTPRTTSDVFRTCSAGSAASRLLGSASHNYEIAPLHGTTPSNVSSPSNFSAPRSRTSRHKCDRCQRRRPRSSRTIRADFARPTRLDVPLRQGQLACSTQCSPTDPMIALATAPRPRWPTISSSAPSAALHRTAPG